MACDGPRGMDGIEEGPGGRGRPMDGLVNWLSHGSDACQVSRTVIKPDLYDDYAEPIFDSLPAKSQRYGSKPEATPSKFALATSYFATPKDDKDEPGGDIYGRGNGQAGGGDSRTKWEDSRFPGKQQFSIKKIGAASSSSKRGSGFVRPSFDVSPMSSENMDALTQNRAQALAELHEMRNVRQPGSAKPSRQRPLNIAFDKMESEMNAMASRIINPQPTRPLKPAPEPTLRKRRATNTKPPLLPLYPESEKKSNNVLLNSSKPPSFLRMNTRPADNNSFRALPQRWSEDGPMQPLEAVDDDNPTSQRIVAGAGYKRKRMNPWEADVSEWEAWNPGLGVDGLSETARALLGTGPSPAKPVAKLLPWEFGSRRGLEEFRVSGGSNARAVSVDPTEAAYKIMFERQQEMDRGVVMTRNVKREKSSSPPPQQPSRSLGLLDAFKLPPLSPSQQTPRIPMGFSSTSFWQRPAYLPDEPIDPRTPIRPDSTPVGHNKPKSSPFGSLLFEAPPFVKEDPAYMYDPPPPIPLAVPPSQTQTMSYSEQASVQPIQRATLFGWPMKKANGNLSPFGRRPSANNEAPSPFGRRPESPAASPMRRAVGGEQRDADAGERPTTNIFMKQMCRSVNNAVAVTAPPVVVKREPGGNHLADVESTGGRLLTSLPFATRIWAAPSTKKQHLAASNVNTTLTVPAMVIPPRTAANPAAAVAGGGMGGVGAEGDIPSSASPSERALMRRRDAESHMVKPDPDIGSAVGTWDAIGDAGDPDGNAIGHVNGGADGGGISNAGSVVENHMVIPDPGCGQAREEATGYGQGQQEALGYGQLEHQENPGFYQPMEETGFYENEGPKGFYTKESLPQSSYTKPEREDSFDNGGIEDAELAKLQV
ncbi:hypothetical protein HK101_009706 [Irineochytrium annulatum]|nr:hypothetical protein HK101_009706 [Irineochytrium annulatum]